MPWLFLGEQAPNVTLRNGAKAVAGAFLARWNEHEERALQYRQRAKELTAILPDMTDEFCHKTLEKLIRDYEYLAKVQDKLGAISAKL